MDEGKVNVDDLVEKYLPEFQGQMWAAEQDAACLMKISLIGGSSNLSARHHGVYPRGAVIGG